MPKDEEDLVAEAERPKPWSTEVRDALRRCGWSDEDASGDRVGSGARAQSARDVLRLAQMGLTRAEIVMLHGKGVPLSRITSVRLGAGKEGPGDHIVVVDDAPRSISRMKKGQWENGKWVSAGGVQQFRPKTGGMLNQGGTRGNRGGGRTPKAVREKLRKMFLKNIEILEEIASDPKAKKSERMKALNMMAEFGLGKATVVLDRQGLEQDVGLTFREVYNPTLRRTVPEDEEDYEQGELPPDGSGREELGAPGDARDLPAGEGA